MADAAAAYLTEQLERDRLQLAPEPEEPEGVELRDLGSDLQPEELIQIALAVARRERSARKDAAARLGRVE